MLYVARYLTILAVLVCFANAGFVEAGHARAKTCGTFPVEFTQTHPIATALLIADQSDESGPVATMGKVFHLAHCATMWADIADDPMHLPKACRACIAFATFDRAQGIASKTLERPPRG